MDDRLVEEGNHVSPESAVNVEGRKAMIFYFQLPENEMQYLAGYSSFEKILLSSLAHILRLGVYLDQKIKGTAGEIDLKALDASACKQYIKTALVSNFAADKYFPLRLSGPSMKSVLRAIPLRCPSATSSKGIFQLCIWRTFAFGNKNHISKLDLGQQTSPNLASIVTAITAWGGEKNIAVPVYGNFQVIKGKIPTMLQLLWEVSQKVSTDFATQVSPYTFTELYEILCQKAIPSIPRGGIINWLLASDFFEYGLCDTPTEKDLAEHIMPSKSSRGSPAGPTAALKYAAKESNEQFPKDADALARVLHNTFEVFNNPPEQMQMIQKLALDCEEVQGRKLSMVDMEHALCKIARQINQGRENKK